ncbi:MAG: hypothetical protein COB04_10175 [Gammaproteobacteria bacterium]|nr:MAG: hypothetical protein COB04_10175 [Gammaproteobacteria bacterium]
MKSLSRITALTAALTALLSFNASATVIAAYDVLNYNDGAAPHGLWTNGNFLPDNTFSISSGDFIVDETGGVITGTLNAVAQSDAYTAIIDLSLSDWHDEFAYKVELGLETSPGENSFADFFETLAGTITITDNSDSSNTQSFTVENCGSCGFGFQYGLGANAKVKDEIGGSAWIQNQFQTGYDHWDLNFAFKSRSVPEPASIVLLGLGLVGIGAARKKRS